MATNIPITVYRDSNGLTEFTNEGANFIVDTLGDNLVDTDANYIVDTGVITTPIPQTNWQEDDSL